MATAALITVPVLWNNVGSFLNNQLITIDADSRILGVVSKPSLPYQPGHPLGVPQINLIQVVTVPFGTLFVNLTLAQYKNLVSEAIQSLNKEITLTFDIPGDIPAGDTLTSTSLYNFQINSIAVGSATGLSPVSVTIIPFTQDDDALTGTLDFTAIGGLSDPSTVEITGYKK